MNLDKAIDFVNNERAQTIPNAFINIFSNKPLYVFNEFVKKYIGAFSPNYLFLTGDTLGVEVFSFGSMDYFIILIFLYLIGFCSLLRKTKSLADIHLFSLNITNNFEHFRQRRFLCFESFTAFSFIDSFLQLMAFTIRLLFLNPNSKSIKTSLRLLLFLHI